MRRVAEDDPIEYIVACPACLCVDVSDGNGFEVGVGDAAICHDCGHTFVVQEINLYTYEELHDISYSN